MLSTRKNYLWLTVKISPWRSALDHSLCSGRVQSLHVDVDVEDVLAQAVCLYASFSGQ